MGSSLRDCVLNALREVCELPSRGQRCRAHSSGRGCHIVGLKDRHGMKRWGRLSSRGVGASRESWNRLTGLGWLGGLHRPTDGRGRAKVRGHRLIERRHLLVPLFLSAVYGGEGGWRGSTQAGRVGGVPRPGEFFWTSGKNCEARWRGVWLRPWLEPFIQAAASWLLRRRPLQTQLIHSLGQDAEQFGIHARLRLAGLYRRKEGGVNSLARQLLCVWCSQVSRCHPGPRLHFPRTRPGRSQPQRDAGPDGRKRRGEPLLWERVRYVGSELA